MSEHQADPISENLAANVDAGTSAADTVHTAPSESEIESPKLAPEAGAANSAAEAAKVEAPKVEIPKADASRSAGKIMIMAPVRDHGWSGDGKAQAESNQDHAATGVLGKRRISAMAAVIALAAVAGALGGALATAGIGHLAADDGSKTASLQARALEESIMRIDADIAALKKQSVAQVGKFNDRFDKVEKSVDRVEKAQVEPAARLAKLSEAVDKLKSPPAPVVQPVAAAAAPVKEATGSIQAPVPTPAPKPEVARLPTVEGWVLRDVANGGAMIEGRQGIYEVYAGDPVPGLGRVDAIRKQDGRWVVVTSRGLIIAR